MSNTESANDFEIAARIQRILNEKYVGPARPRVLADEVRLAGDAAKMWYVPVSIHRDTEHMYLVYQALSEAEEQLEADDIEVLLVPRIIPFQKLEDIA